MAGSSIRKRIKFSDGKRVEIEEVYSARFEKDIPNGKRVKATAEEVKRINERNRIKKLRRLIYENFSDEDWHLTLTYQKDKRPNPEQAKEFLDKFIKKMRKEHKKQGKKFKWIAVTEFYNKAIHHHLIINDYDFTVKLVKELWIYGSPNFSGLYKNDDYEALAVYLIKETSKSKSDPDIKNKPTYRASRNLRKPKETTKIISSKNFLKPPKPPRGWYIEKSTYQEGVNKINNKPFRYYTLIKTEIRRE